MKRYLAFVLTMILLAATLWGCGAATMGSTGNGAARDEMAYAPEMAPAEDGLTSDTSGTAQTPTNQKLVRKIRLEAETDDLDTLLMKVDEKLAELSGYAENRQVFQYSGRQTRTRTAELTLRIPAAQLDQFVTHVTGLSNVTSSTETAEDITLNYIATESRVKALQTEHDRLLELLAEAESMSDLLEIEKRLTQVRTELEEVASRLKLYDNMVDYGTVYLTLQEVKEFTDITQPETMWQRMGKGFLESLSNLGDMLTEFCVWLVASLPYFIVLGVITLVIVLLIKHRRNKKKRTRPTMGCNGSEDAPKAE